MPILRSGVLEDAEIEALLPQIAKVYVGAFAGEPWYEVSACADETTPQGCEGGFSPLAIGQVCPHCNNVLTEAAYKPKELVEHFKGVMKLRDTAWYVEETKKNDAPTLALAAFAWKVTGPALASVKYKENESEMSAFFETLFPAGESFAWLDEIFADRTIRAEGNLRNFKNAVRGLGTKLGENHVAFRTINERLIAAAQRDFPQGAQVHRSPDVPDRRAVVIIDLTKDEV